MELLTIGAFARAAGLTAKALRLYDEQGLLRPAAVDAVTGYRFYAPDQLGRARLIARLRRVDMPLARIREVCDLPPASAASVVASFRAGLEADAAARAHEAGLLVDLLRGTLMTTLGLTSAARTAIGLVRQTNEDVAYADSTVLAVADGLGGLPNGEAAGEAAVAAMRAGAADLGEFADRVAAAGRAIKALDGPATTLTALIRSGDKLLLAHVGDTRAYLLRNGELFRLTQDHSYVQTLVDAGRIGAGEAATHPQRPVLVRALGGGNDDPDLGQRALLAGDRYLLCSDGLWAAVPPAELAAALPGDDPDTVADRLIELAHTHGAPDNVAVVVADVQVAD